MTLISTLYTFRSLQYYLSNFHVRGWKNNHKFSTRFTTSPFPYIPTCLTLFCSWRNLQTKSLRFRIITAAGAHHIEKLKLLNHRYNWFELGALETLLFQSTQLKKSFKVEMFWCEENRKKKCVEKLNFLHYEFDWIVDVLLHFFSSKQTYKILYIFSNGKLFKLVLYSTDP